MGNRDAEPKAKTLKPRLLNPGMTLREPQATMAGNGPAPSSQSTGAEGAPTTIRSEDAWEAEYDEMASTLGLGVVESQALRSAFEAREAEVGAWLKGERGARHVQLEGELKRAAQDEDL